MKSAGSSQKPYSSKGQKPHAVGTSNRPRVNEEQEQRQLPLREQAKKDTSSRQRSGSPNKG